MSQHAARPVIGLILLTGLCTGCAIEPPARAVQTTTPAVPTQPGVAAESANSLLEPSAVVQLGSDHPAPSDGERPVAATSAGAATLEPARFAVRVDNLPAEQFFLGLARASRQNLLIHPDVTGRLSLDLRDVTLDAVLALVRDVYGYEFHTTGETTVITPARMQAQVFEVGYLNIERHGRSRSSIGATPAPRGNTAAQQPSLDTPQRSSAIETVTHSDVWGPLQTVLERIIGADDDRDVVIDRHAGLVVVRAMPGELRDVAAYLQRLREQLGRQVLLEAQILEVTLADGFQAGVDWALLGRQASRLVAAGSSIQGGVRQPIEPGSAPDTTMLSMLPGGLAAETAGLFAAGVIAPDFAGLIRLLATQGEVRVLSSPRVATLSNQKAVIKAGSNAYFVTDVRTTGATLPAADGSRIAGGFDVELSPFFSGISLDVTPHIGRDGEVTLHIHPSVTDVVDQTRLLQIGGETQSLPLALSTLREADTVVRARDGEVVVIGGLMQERESTQRGDVPFFSRIPLLGGLFRQRRHEHRLTELVILLRPTLIPVTTPQRSAVSAP